MRFRMRWHEVAERGFVAPSRAARGGFLQRHAAVRKLMRSGECQMETLWRKTEGVQADGKAPASSNSSHSVIFGRRSSVFNPRWTHLKTTVSGLRIRMGDDE